MRATKMLSKAAEYGELIVDLANLGMPSWQLSTAMQPEYFIEFAQKRLPGAADLYLKSQSSFFSYEG